MSKPDDMKRRAAEDARRGHRQVDDTSTRGVALFGVGLLVLLAAVFGGIALFINLLENDVPQARGPYAHDTTARRGPHLQVDPAVDLMEVYKREERLLSEYRWIDREAGIVAIPIDRAMQLVADRAGEESGEPDSIRILTESGYVNRPIGPLSAPPYLSRSPEPYHANPDLRTILSYLDAYGETSH